MAFVTCDYPECRALAKLQGGQRRFCQDHHLVSLDTNPDYSAAVNQYEIDPEVVAAMAAFTRAIEEAGGTNALIFMFAPLDAAEELFYATLKAARERLQPGIHAAEAIADNAYRVEQARLSEIYYDSLLAEDKARQADDEREETEDEAHDTE